MNNSRFDKETSNPGKNKKGFSKLMSLIVFGVAAAALIGLGTLIFSESSNTVTAQVKNDPASPQNKKYVATRNIVVDKETGRARRPNETEIKELVESLAALTSRSDENLESFAVAGGGDAVDVDSGFGGTILARPNAEGIMETKCVFSFEEAAEFLGLVEESSTK
jgi:hypothetical protein